MKRSLFIASLLAMAVAAFIPQAAAQDIAACGCYCGKVIRPPCSDNACKQACGWKGSSSAGSSSSADEDAAAAAAAAAAAEAERRRQEELIRQQELARRKLEAEDARRRQAEFDLNKQKALGDLKGISGELGIKDLDTDNGLGIKDNIGAVPAGTAGNVPSNPPDAAPASPSRCKWGDLDSSVVDLRCLGLDPGKPIVVDWHVVAGQQRVFPAQVDQATFQNSNYNKGFDALMRTTFSVKDAMDAVAFFKAARLQRPNDALVRDALYVAEGILQARQQKQQEQKQQAEQQLYRGIAALMIGDEKTAGDSIERASALDSSNTTINSWSSLIMGLQANSEAGNRLACRFVGNALVSEALGDTRAEIRTLETAEHMFPNDVYVKTMLWRVRHLPTDRSSPSDSAHAPK